MNDPSLDTIARALGGSHSLDTYQAAVAQHAGQGLVLEVRGSGSSYKIVMLGHPQEALEAYIRALEQSKKGPNRWVLYKRLNASPGDLQQVSSGEVFLEFTAEDALLHNMDEIAKLVKGLKL